MDYAYWWWHWATHMVPSSGDFIIVHHTDLDLDVTHGRAISLRRNDPFHGFLSLAVVLSVIGPIMLVAFFIAFEAATLFHHSNWRLPIPVERILNLILVTPRMHGIHHSIRAARDQFKLGHDVCWWDKLHRTLRRDVPQDAITIGVAAYREENELTLGKLFACRFVRSAKMAITKRRRPRIASRN